jgi:hypothetical protein
VEDMSLRGEEWRIYEAPRDSPSQMSDSGIIECVCVCDVYGARDPRDPALVLC